MSTNRSAGPCWVDHDRAAAGRAARAALLAYGTDWRLLWRAAALFAFLGVALAGFTIVGLSRLSAPAVVWRDAIGWGAFVGAALAPFGVVARAGVVAFETWNASRSTRNRLAYFSDGLNVASCVAQFKTADRVFVCSRASWRRSQHLGPQLNAWMLEQLRNAGVTYVYGTAFPWLVPIYTRPQWGAVVGGSACPGRRMIWLDERSGGTLS